MLQGALDGGEGVGSNEVINRIVSAGSPRGNHLIFCPSVKRLEMGEGVIRERERERRILPKQMHSYTDRVDEACFGQCAA